MNEREILNLENCVVENPKWKCVHCFAVLVQNCNFNDEFYIADRTSLAEDLNGKPLVWFDPYLGKYKASDIKIAIAYVSGYDIHYIEEKNGEKTVKTATISQDVGVEKYDDRQLIVARLSLSDYKGD